MTKTKRNFVEEVKQDEHEGDEKWREEEKE